MAIFCCPETLNEKVALHDLLNKLLCEGPSDLRIICAYDVRGLNQCGQEGILSIVKQADSPIKAYHNNICNKTVTINHQGYRDVERHINGKMHLARGQICGVIIIR